MPLEVDIAIQEFPCSICHEMVQPGDQVTMMITHYEGDMGFIATNKRDIPMIAHYECAPEPEIH